MEPTQQTSISNQSLTYFWVDEVGIQSTCPLYTIYDFMFVVAREKGKRKYCYSKVSKNLDDGDTYSLEKK